MAKQRSPNYPNWDLKAALGMVGKIYAEDGRNKVSRSTVAKHLGHESLSGPALAKIGALRAYGLLEGTGEELRVSNDAVSALKAPVGSTERGDAIKHLAGKPGLFQMVRKDFPGRVSKDNLVFWLIKKGFSDSAAGVAANAYLGTLRLVEELGGGYNASDSQAVEMAETAAPRHQTPPVASPSKLMEGERVVFTEEKQPLHYLKVIAAGEVDEFMLGALADFVKRRRELLQLLKQPTDQAVRPTWVGKTFEAGDEVPETTRFQSHHNGHMPVHEIVELEEGDTFPACDRCEGGPVRYKMA